MNSSTSDNPSEPGAARRPLRSRDRWWSRRLTHWLQSKGAKPNHVSLASIGFALLGAVFLFLNSADAAMWVHTGVLFLAALAIQLRLLCNLLDGMLAVEGGLRSKSGSIFNELPDRISDSMLLVGAAYGVGVPALGWSSALLAVGTAYVRMLGVASGTANFFCGPMAKPQRMAVITAACVLQALAPYFGVTYDFILLSLWIVLIGSILTCVRRTILIIHYLENEADHAAQP